MSVVDACNCKISFDLLRLLLKPFPPEVRSTITATISPQQWHALQECSQFTSIETWNGDEQEGERKAAGITLRVDTDIKLDRVVLRDSIGIRIGAIINLGISEGAY